MSNQLAVIFDWGGVLMRTENRSLRLHWDRQLGLAPGSVEGIVHGVDAWRQVQCGTITLEAYWQHVGNELKMTPAEVAQLQHDFYQGDRLDIALIALIEELRDGGILVGLLSNNSPDLADMLAEMAISPLFDAAVISSHIGIMKPDERAYWAILDMLRVKPAQAILVDDFVQNVEGARQIGMAAIHFTPDCDLRSHLAQWLSGR